MTFVVYMCLLALNNVTYRKEPNCQKKEKTNKRQLSVTSNLATRKGMPDDVVPGPLQGWIQRFDNVSQKMICPAGSFFRYPLRGVPRLAKTALPNILVGI